MTEGVFFSGQEDCLTMNETGEFFVSVEYLARLPHHRLPGTFKFTKGSPESKVVTREGLSTLVACVIPECVEVTNLPYVFCLWFLFFLLQPSFLRWTASLGRKL